MEPEVSLPCPEPIQHNVIFHLRFRLPSGLFPLGFPTKKLCAFLICRIRPTRCC